MKTIIIIFLVLIFCISCKKEQTSEPFKQTPYELWRSKNLHNYSINQIRSCFCPDASEIVRITVRSDTIFSVVKLSDTTLVISPFYFTVDSLFGIINNSKTDSLVIRYNAIYGFPEYLDVNPQLHPVDGGVLYETSDLQRQ